MTEQQTDWYNDLRVDLPEHTTVGDLIKTLQKFDKTAEVYITAEHSDVIVHPSLVTMQTYNDLSTLRYVLIDINGYDLHSAGESYVL